MERTGGIKVSIEKYEPSQALQVFEKRWGTLQANQREAEGTKLVDLVALGFDPILHLQLYQGRVTTTIDGMYWWASGDKRFERMVSEPIAPALKDAYGLGPDDIGVITKLYIKGLAEPFCTGFGKASMKTDRNPVSKDHPYRMGEKRSEAQAIRKMRPIGVQVFTPEDVIEGQLVDTVTGEVRPPPEQPKTTPQKSPSAGVPPTQVPPKAPEAGQRASQGPVIADGGVAIADIKSVGGLGAYLKANYGPRATRNIVELVTGKPLSALATTEDLQAAARMVDAVAQALGDVHIVHATPEQMTAAIMQVKGG